MRTSHRLRTSRADFRGTVSTYTPHCARTSSPTVGSRGCATASFWRLRQHRECSKGMRPRVGHLGSERTTANTDVTDFHQTQNLSCLCSWSSFITQTLDLSHTSANARTSLLARTSFGCENSFRASPPSRESLRRLLWCTCVSASARQSRAQCCARELCKILFDRLYE